MVKLHEGVLLPFIDIERSSAAAMFRQVQDQLRTAILNGTLPRGMRLPASRVLAEELGVSRPTIVHVLDNLKSEGYLRARQGSGTFVAEDLPQHLPRPGRAKAQRAPQDISEARISHIGQLVRTLSTDLGKADYRPFLPNFPAFDAFPVATWRKCWNSAGRAARRDSLGYGDPAGYAPLRKSIAEYLALHRGDTCDPEQIIITPGSHAAFTMASLLLANPGDKIWFENPGPVTVRGLFTSLGLKMAPVRVDREGMDVNSAAKSHPDARLAFVMPSRQHPLGVTLSLPRRLALLAQARQTGMWIIEDDYDSEFRYVGRPLPSLRSIDSTGQVIYVGTFSKALYPAIRVGYLVLPHRLVDLFRNLGALISRSVPLEMQAVLAEFIGGGHFVTHLRRMRDLYTTRRSAFLENASNTLNGLAEIENPDSGMNAIAWLRCNDKAAHVEALREGVQCFPLSDYTVGKPQNNALILGFTGVRPERMKPGLAQLAKAISRASSN